MGKTGQTLPTSFFLQLCKFQNFPNSKKTDYGIPADKNILNDIGSSLRIKYKYVPLREIVLETEFYFYTNYKKVEIDWQTTCNFIINRFMTARVSLHPRFDNTYIASGETKAKLQFKELLSVGFSHTFR